MKLQTTTDRYPASMHSSILDMTQDLMHAREELMQTGIEMSAADRLVDDLLLGLDIVQNYDKHEGVQATMECLEAIVSRTEVDIEESCEGLGSAIKAAWDKFIEICKTIYKKIKEFILKLCGFVSGGYNATIDKTKQLIARIKGGKGSKESLSASLEGYGGKNENDVISVSDVKCFTKFIKQALPLVQAELGIMSMLQMALTTLVNNPEERETIEGYLANAEAQGEKAKKDVAGQGEMLSSLLMFSDVEVFDRKIPIFRSIQPSHYGESISRWNESALIASLQEIEKYAPFVKKASDKISKMSSVAEIDPEKWDKLVEAQLAKIENANKDKDVKTPKSVMIQAKILIRSLVRCGGYAADLVNRAVQLHRLLNDRLEDVATKLGY